MLQPTPMKAVRVGAPADRAFCGTGVVQRPVSVSYGRSRVSTVCLAGKTKAKKTNSKKASTSTGGSGFGAKRQVEETRPNKNLYNYPRLDESLKISETAEYFLFVRKRGDDETEPGRWMPVGDITIESDAKVESAVKERRGILRDYSQVKYMKLKILKKGERLEYGARVQRAPTMDAENATAIWPLNVEGAIVDTVPARLQLLSDLQWDMKEKSNSMNADAVVEQQKRLAREGKPTTVVDTLKPVDDSAPLLTPLASQGDAPNATKTFKFN